MLIKVLLNFLLFVIVVNGQSVHSCKNLQCKSDEYCSPSHALCFKCAEICSEGHELQDDCKVGCAAYLAERNKTQQSLEVQELKDNVKSLQSLVKVSFILSGVAILITCILILFLTYKWCQRKGLTISTMLYYKPEKKNPTTNNREPTDTSLSDVKIQTISRNDLQIKMSDSVTGDTVVDSPTTVTTTISRRGAPSESRGFDYTYDNPAMSTQGTQGSRDTGF